MLIVLWVETITSKPLTDKHALQIPQSESTLIDSPSWFVLKIFPGGLNNLETEQAYTSCKTSIVSQQGNTGQPCACF